MRLRQVYGIHRLARRRGQVISRPFGEIGTQMARALVRTGMSRECWRNSIVRSSIGLPAALGRQRASMDKLSRELAQLLKFRSHQPPDLLFQSADAGDLSHAGWDAEWQQVTGNIKRALRGCAGRRRASCLQDVAGSPREKPGRAAALRYMPPVTLQRNYSTAPLRSR